jgi:hypothetical protein
MSVESVSIRKHSRTPESISEVSGAVSSPNAWEVPEDITGM